MKTLYRFATLPLAILICGGCLDSAPSVNPANNGVNNNGVNNNGVNKDLGRDDGVIFVEQDLGMPDLGEQMDLGIELEVTNPEFVSLSEAFVIGVEPRQSDCRIDVPANAFAIDGPNLTGVVPGRYTIEVTCEDGTGTSEVTVLPTTAQVSDVMLWLNGNEGLTVDEESQSVSEWLDLGPSQNHFSSFPASSSPTKSEPSLLQNNGGIHLNLGEMMVASDSIDFVGARVFLVLRMPSVDQDSSRAWLSSTEMMSSVLAYLDSTTFSAFFVAGDVQTNTADVSVPAGSFADINILSVRLQQNEVRLDIAGSLNSYRADYGGAFIPNYSFNALGTPNQAGGWASTIGDIAEVIIIKNVDAPTTPTMTYLTRKYGQ